MNEKEVAEIRRRFRLEKSNITHVRVCYVNENREIISQFNQSLAMTEQEETEQILACLKRVLSGTLGKNLMDVTFTTQQVVDSEEHRLLMALKNSAFTFLQGARLLKLGHLLLPIGPVFLTSPGGKVFLLLVYMNQVAVQRLQLGFLSLQERQVGFADPISQQRLRPAVRDDMMGFHQNSAVGFH